MAKPARSNSKRDPIDIEALDKSEPQALEPSFSAGDLGQLQEILFGQQQRSTNLLIASVQQQVSEQLEVTSNMLNSRLNQLTESFNTSHQKLESKLQALDAEHSKAREDMCQMMNSENVALRASVNELSRSANSDAKRFSETLNQLESKINSELAEATRTLQSEIHDSASALQTAKLDTQNLAALFGDISDKLGASASSISKKDQ